MKKFLAIILVALSATGCATSDYKMYVESQVAVAQAKAQADTARYAALAQIAQSGDSAAKVAAVISLNMQSGNGGSQVAQLAAPRSAGDTALAWASILLPNVTQMYSVNRQTELGIAQSNNAAQVSIGTTRAFVDIAGKIQAPVVAVPQANVSNVTTNTSSIDIRDSGNQTSSVVRNTDIVRDSNNTTNTNRTVTRDSNNQTTTTTTNNTTTNTTNKTNSENVTRTDNTSTPTVVTQPAPVVVTP